MIAPATHPWLSVVISPVFSALVVQRIEREPPKPEIQVRFLAGAETTGAERVSACGMVRRVYYLECHWAIK